MFFQVDLDPDATSFDGSLNTEYLTGVNTAATALTDITKSFIQSKNN